MNRKAYIRIVLAWAALCLALGACRGETVSIKSNIPGAAIGETVSMKSNISGAAIIELAYSSDGAFLYVVSADALVRVWDTGTGELKACLTAVSAAAAAEQEGQTLYAGGELPPATDKATARVIGEGGKLIAYGYADGSVIVRERESGAELVRHIGGENGEWISIVPAGYFKASPQGGNLVEVQSGDDRYTMSQLSEVFRRNDIFEEALGGSPISGITLQELLQDANSQAPLVEIMEGGNGIDTKDAVADIRVQVTARNGGVGYLVVRNGESVIALPSLEGGQTSIVQGQTRYEVSLTVPVEPGENQIGVSCFNANHTIESGISRVTVQADYRAAAGKPTLYVLAAAIKDYQDNRDYSNLSYTVNDADRIGELFSRQQTGSLYEDVVIQRLYNSDVTRDGLAKAFDELGKRVKPQDIFVFFFSGHGDVDQRKDFFLVPWDTPAGQPIVKQDIISNIMKIRSRGTLMMLDTCRSGALMDMETAFGRLLEKLGQKAVLVAASGEQSAVESGELEHGVFSYVLLDKYSGSPELGDARYTDDRQLISYVKEQVPLEVARLQERGKLSGAGSRGATRRELIMQEPLGWFPERSFNLLDRYLEPGSLNISTVSAGTLVVEGGAPERLRAGEKVTKTLAEKKYTVSMLYADGEREEQTVEVQNNGVTEVRFTHTVPVKNEMVRINGGTFMMGSPATEAGRYNREGPQHLVTVSGFSMSRYEVTQQEYEEVMGNNPSNWKGSDLPVERVSWYNAVEYCNRRSVKEGLTPVYTISGTRVTWNRDAQADPRSAGYRLPTEAEWEYACRAGTTGPFSTGNNITTNQANYNGYEPYNNNPRGVYRQKTVDAGSYAPNAWGLYDMHGNVWEWCWDWEDDNTYDGGAQTNPVGADSGAVRAARGGSWSNYGQNLRSAYRGSYAPSDRSDNLGFRLVRSVR
ncbi:hypothetical protein FACS1894151_08810 [Spirochaetia bacterium]|nr:hypothetical protein FACS1894151_08810 [Spirochaetia bacterium]